MSENVCWQLLMAYDVCLTMGEAEPQDKPTILADIMDTIHMYQYVVLQDPGSMELPPSTPSTVSGHE